MPRSLTLGDTIFSGWLQSEYCAEEQPHQRSDADMSQTGAEAKGRKGHCNCAEGSRDERRYDCLL